MRINFSQDTEYLFIATEQSEIKTESKSEAYREWVEEERKKGRCDNGFILQTGEVRVTILKG